ncbi:MAG: hypothetical protein ACTXOO_01855 [Sodalis sp. (in: enterobacteria)]
MKHTVLRIALFEVNKRHNLLYKVIIKEAIELESPLVKERSINLPNYAFYAATSAGCIVLSLLSMPPLRISASVPPKL